MEHVRLNSIVFARKPLELGQIEIPEFLPYRMLYPGPETVWIRGAFEDDLKRVNVSMRLPSKILPASHPLIQVTGLNVSCDLC